jgi:hypothetical protein
MKADKTRAVAGVQEEFAESLAPPLTPFRERREEFVAVERRSRAENNSVYRRSSAFIGGPKMNWPSELRVAPAR